MTVLLNYKIAKLGKLLIAFHEAELFFAWLEKAVFSRRFTNDYKNLHFTTLSNAMIVLPNTAETETKYP